MKGFLALAICLLPLGLFGQWSHQLQFGWKLGSDQAVESVRLTDTLEYSFSKKSLRYPSGAFMLTYQINEILLFRTGIDGTKTPVDVRVVNTRNNDDVFYERRTFADLHVPLEIQYEASKGFFLNGGLSVNARVEFFRIPLNELVQSNQPLGDPRILDEFEEVAYNSMRQVSLNYRIGTTMKFVPWLGVDLMYDRPLMNLVKSPLSYQGDEADVKFKYGTWTMRLVYFFEWQKLKKSLNQNSGKRDFW